MDRLIGIPALALMVLGLLVKNNNLSVIGLGMFGLYFIIGGVMVFKRRRFRGPFFAPDITKGNSARIWGAIMITLGSFVICICLKLFGLL